MPTNVDELLSLVNQSRDNFSGPIALTLVSHLVALLEQQQHQASRVLSLDNERPSYVRKLEAKDHLPHEIVMELTSNSSKKEKSPEAILADLQRRGKLSPESGIVHCSKNTAKKESIIGNGNGNGAPSTIRLYANNPAILEDLKKHLPSCCIMRDLTRIFRPRIKVLSVPIEQIPDVMIALGDRNAPRLLAQIPAGCNNWGKSDLVVEISSTGFQHFVSLGRLFVASALAVYDVRESFDLQVCSHCQRLGHSSARCNFKVIEQVTCGRCAGAGHAEQECHSSKLLCANCVRDYRGLGSVTGQQRADHMASDSTCPMAMSYIEYRINNTVFDVGKL